MYKGRATLKKNEAVNWCFYLVWLSLSTAWEPLQLFFWSFPAVGCVCAKSVCRWTWKDPLVNAICNQLDLLVAGFVAQDLYSCSLSVCAFAANRIEYPRSQQQLVGDSQAKQRANVASHISANTFLWGDVYCLQLFWTSCQYFSPLKVFLLVYHSFWSCNKSRIKRFTATIFKCW